jgi:hypothetical protein
LEEGGEDGLDVGVGVAHTVQFIRGQCCWGGGVATCVPITGLLV